MLHCRPMPRGSTMNSTEMIQVLVPARRRIRRQQCLKIRIWRKPRPENAFISRKEVLLGVLLLVLSVLALHWITLDAAPPEGPETPVSASAYRT